MERKNSKKSANLSNSDKPVEEPKQEDESGEELDEKCQPTSLSVESKMLDLTSSPASEPTHGVEITSSEEKPGTSKSFHRSEHATETRSSVFEDEKEPTILNLPELELISISSRIAEANERYLAQVDVTNQSKPFYAADTRREGEEAAQRQRSAEARRQASLQQKDSLLTETGGVINLAMLRGIKENKEVGDGEVGDQPNLLNLQRSRILIGLITNRFVDLQELRFNAEVLMQFLEERRSLLGDGRHKLKDPYNSPSIPKFNLRPIVKGLNEVMDKLHSILENFIKSTRDIVKKYRSKSPELDEKAFRDYTNQFFELRERLEQLEDLLRARGEEFIGKDKILNEIVELRKQSKTLNKLLVNSYFKFAEILYKFNNCISEIPIL